MAHRFLLALSAFGIVALSSFGAVALDPRLTAIRATLKTNAVKSCIARATERSGNKDELKETISTYCGCLFSIVDTMSDDDILDFLTSEIQSQLPSKTVQSVFDSQDAKCKPTK